jgi:DNA-binding NarL/FixJ family response regulator
MTTTQPKSKHDLSDPDLVDRIFAYIFADPAMARAVEVIQKGSREKIEDLKAAVRSEFSGERVYITATTKRQQRVAEVLRLFNGRNSTEVARTLGITRRSVYRYIKQAGGPEKAHRPKQ